MFHPELSARWSACSHSVTRHTPHSVTRHTPHAPSGESCNLIVFLAYEYIIQAATAVVVYIAESAVAATAAAIVYDL